MSQLITTQSDYDDSSNGVRLIEELRNFELRRLTTKRNAVSKHLKENKDEAINISRKVPIELLALDWLNKIDASIETRAYLVENFLPVLVLGCEKVLQEASKRNLVEQNKSDVNYNPLNYLAQYLMRNNPKYNNQNETSSYIRTMREVYQELREKMFAFQENKLAKIKADVRQRRDEREKQEKLKLIEKERRKVSVENLFTKWCLSDHGRLEMKIIEELFKMFQAHSRFLPDEINALAKLNFNSIPSFCFTFDKLDSEKRLMKFEFVQCLTNVSESMTSDLFDFFMEFSAECANYFINSANKSRINRILYKLFEMLDTSKTGLLSRKRIIELLNNYNKEDEQSQSNFRDPTKWPVLDPFIKFKNENLNNTEDIMETAEQTDELKSTIMNTEDLDETTGEQITLLKNDSKSFESPSQNMIEIKDTVEIIEKEKLSGNLNTESLTKINNVGEQQALEVIDVKNTEKSEVDFLPSQPTQREEDESEVTEKKISMDDEILFIKGGLMYYKPLTAPINAFDSKMIQNEFSETKELFKFNTDFLNSTQFVNIINNYVLPRLYSSENTLNGFINYIKNNFSETTLEKNIKIEFVEQLKRKHTNEEKFSKIFDKIDNDCSGEIDLNTISILLEQFKDGMYRDLIRSITAQFKDDILNSTNKQNDDDIKLTIDDFNKYLSVLIEQVQSPMIADQICQYLYNSAQFDYSQRVRGEHRKIWLQELIEIGEGLSGNFELLSSHLITCLAKDAEKHGENKTISAYLGLLEKITPNEVGLKYHAATPQDSKYIVGKTLSRKIPNISFEAIDKQKTIYIQNVRSNNSVHYFNKENDQNGSLVIIPLQLNRNKIYGVLGIDTLQESSNKNIQDYEIEFYKGVASTFAKAYANIIFKNNLTDACINGIEWLKKRCEFIEECNLYFVEKELNNDKQNSMSNFSMKSVIKCNSKNEIIIESKNTNNDESLIKNKDNLNYIGPHIKDCAINSESTVGYFNKETSFCYALRNEEHKTIFVIEILLKGKGDENENEAVEIDTNQIESVLYILNKCQEELLCENLLSETKIDFEFEDTNEKLRSKILFEKKYYNYIFEQISKHINSVVPLPENYTELHPKINDVIQLIGDLIDNKEFTQNKMLTQEVINKLKLLDPTSSNFSFHKLSSAIDLSKASSLNDLHSIQLLLTENDHKIVRLLVEWLYLIKTLNHKVLKLKEN